MTNFIEQFYYGNIDPQECSSELKFELKEKLNELTQIEKRLGEKLTDEDQKLFSEYSDKYLEFLTTNITDGFINGFRLGAKFTYDTLYKTALSPFVSGFMTKNAPQRFFCGAKFIK